MNNVYFNGTSGPIDILASGSRKNVQFDIMNTHGKDWFFTGTSVSNIIQVNDSFLQWPDGTRGVSYLNLLFFRSLLYAT